MSAKQIFASVAAVAAIALSAPVSADPMITGEVRTSGEVATDTGNLGTATSLDFLTGFVLSGDGSYFGVTTGTVVTYTDFTFSPALSPNPVNPLWTFNFGGKTYSFVMGTINIDDQSASNLDLSGTGTLSITGFANTPGLWAFSTQSAGGSSAVRFSFSADTEANAVPLPGTLALLGLGLVGLGIARRKQH